MNPILKYPGAKPILDATCGGRMMWFNKHHPAVLYVDKRKLSETHLCDGRTFTVEPDMVADFRRLPFPDGCYSLVVFDPPHLVHVGDKAYMGIKYGKLDGPWEEVIHDGFWECMRVLREHGTLIFKWCEIQIPVSKIVRAIGMEPLFGHKSGKAAKTHWMAFMKGVSA